jgi:hypothetical protein
MEPSMTRIGIILGSTRPNRNGEQVATWVYDIAARRDDAEFELVDLRDHPLPHLEKPLPPSMGQYVGEHTRRWAEKIGSFDGFVIVTPEYNHSTSGEAVGIVSLMTEFENFSVFKPNDYLVGALNTQLDQVVAWSTALAPLRARVSVDA